MDRARVNAILSGQRTLTADARAAKPVIVVADDIIASSKALGTLCRTQSGARPLRLESSQLPPIF